MRKTEIFSPFWTTAITIRSERLGNWSGDLGVGLSRLVLMGAMLVLAGCSNQPHKSDSGPWSTREACNKYTQAGDWYSFGSVYLYEYLTWDKEGTAEALDFYLGQDGRGISIWQALQEAGESSWPLSQESKLSGWSSLEDKFLFYLELEERPDGSTMTAIFVYPRAVDLDRFVSMQEKSSGFYVNVSSTQNLLVKKKAKLEKYKGRWTAKVTTGREDFSRLLNDEDGDRYVDLRFAKGPLFRRDKIDFADARKIAIATYKASSRLLEGSTCGLQ
jgi:hypothetical protein